MKQLMKNSLVLVIFFTLTLTYGKNEKITYVTFENVKAGSILTLKTESGEEMYTEVIKASGNFVKQYDFTLLPKGEYAFELEKDFEIKVKPLTVLANKVYLDNEAEITYFKPVVTRRDNKLLISQLALNDKPLAVKLYYTNKDGEEIVVFNDTFKSNDRHIVEKVLSLSKTHTGNYRLVLSSNDHRYTERFTL